MRILIFGDIVGKPGRQAVHKILPELKYREKIDFVIANGENSAGGSGITPKIFNELICSGIDVLTSGDHIFKNKEILQVIDYQDRLLRPANYPDEVYGRGFCVIKAKSGQKIGVLNLLGRVFMEPLDCPFRKSLEIIKQIREQTSIIIVDMHAEATSEKIAMGWYLNGKVSVVLGTHTHVQTADERVLPEFGHTAYITDIGMTGAIDSVIGRKVEQILKRFLNHTPEKFEVAVKNVELQGIIVEIDEHTGAAKSIKRVKESLKVWA
ncbi:MAG: TIGR00282 family metallophosphoesterase [Candidatus Omnitrophota bacterium]|nr:MAG: TIGR00282 family metallophosphoesterase [Candidatus Omnitrophota bacterium]